MTRASNSTLHCSRLMIVIAVISSAVAFCMVHQHDKTVKLRRFECAADFLKNSPKIAVNDFAFESSVNLSDCNDDLARFERIIIFELQKELQEDSQYRSNTDCLLKKLKELHVVDFKMLKFVHENDQTTTKLEQQAAINRAAIVVEYKLDFAHKLCDPEEVFGEIFDSALAEEFIDEESTIRAPLSTFDSCFDLSTKTDKVKEGVTEDLVRETEYEQSIAVDSEEVQENMIGVVHQEDTETFDFTDADYEESFQKSIVDSKDELELTIDEESCEKLIDLYEEDNIRPLIDDIKVGLQAKLSSLQLACIVSTVRTQYKLSLTINGIRYLYANGEDSESVQRSDYIASMKKIHEDAVECRKTLNEKLIN